MDGELDEEKKLKRKARQAAWEQAMRDPLFVKDVQDVEADFQWADAETARTLDALREETGTRPAHGSNPLRR